MGNFLTAYRAALDDFQKHSIEEIAYFIGCEAANNSFCFKFLGERIAVEHPAGELRSLADDTAELSVVEKTLIFRYLSRTCKKFKDQAELNLAPYKYLFDSAKVNELFVNKVISPLVHMFGNSPERLQEAAVVLGGEQNALGDVGVTIEALPSIYIALVLWKGDRDFPPAGTVLFNESIPLFFDAEDCAELAGLLLKRLVPFSGPKSGLSPGTLGRGGKKGGF